jgi:hypothetical protein
LSNGDERTTRVLGKDTLEKPGTCGDSRACPGSFSSGSVAEAAMPNTRRQRVPAVPAEQRGFRRMSIEC